MLRRRRRSSRPPSRARAHGDAVFLRIPDEVPDDQEVGLEPHLRDHPELELEPLGASAGAGRRRSAAAPRWPAAGAERRVLPLWAGNRGEQQPAELDLDLAALGDLERGRHRPRPARERLLHLGRALEKELVGLEPQLGLFDRGLGLHAEKRRVVRVVLAAQVMDVRRRHQRSPELPGDRTMPSFAFSCSASPLAWTSKYTFSGPKTPSSSSRCARASAGRSATRRWQNLDCRHPVSAITPSAWRSSNSVSTLGLPRPKPSRNPSEVSGRGCEIRPRRTPAA